MAVSEVLQIFPGIETLNDTTKGRPKSSLKNVKKMYHCPVKTCKYFKNEFYFEKIKFLKQHFVKVHKPKSFLCSKCDKQFPLEATLNRHKLMCGVIYRCHCNAEYQAYEALLTHVKRKHKGTTLKYKDMMECLKAHSTAQDFQKQFDNILKVRAIIVKDLNRDNFVYVKKKELINASKETQTGMKMCQILPNVTSKTEALQRKTVSLQTSTENTSRQKKQVLEYKTINNLDEKNVMSSGTQTSPVKQDTNTQSSIDRTKSFNDVNVFDSSSNSSNSFSQIVDGNMMFSEDPILGSVLEEPTCRTGTQTNDAKDISSNTESNLVMCSDSETQTAFDDIFDDSCIDTYTQTCDSLFSDLDFADIETQTSWSFFNDELRDG